MNKALSLFENPRFGMLSDAFIGFDDMFKDMDNILTSSFKEVGFPPYDIYTQDVDKENHTFIKFAVAGIRKDDLAVEFKDNVLRVYTEYKDDAIEKHMKDTNKKYIRKGIAERSFSITKTIDKSLELVGAKYEEGCLIVEFRKKEVKEPECKRIEIQ
jgi:HSP20 family molecular chaperone IbpA